MLAVIGVAVGVGLESTPAVAVLGILALSAAGGQRLGDRAAATQVIAIGSYRPRP